MLGNRTSRGICKASGGFSSLKSILVRYRLTRVLDIAVQMPEAFLFATMRLEVPAPPPWRYFFRKPVIDLGLFSVAAQRRLNGVLDFGVSQQTAAWITH